MRIPHRKLQGGKLHKIFRDVHNSDDNIADRTNHYNDDNMALTVKITLTIVVMISVTIIFGQCECNNNDASDVPAIVPAIIIFIVAETIRLIITVTIGETIKVMITEAMVVFCNLHIPFARHVKVCIHPTAEGFSIRFHL